MTEISTRQTTSRAGAQPTELGEWWQFRGSGRLIGRAALTGDLAKPAVQWRRFCGARESYLSLTLDGAPVESHSLQTIALPHADLQTDQWQQLAIAWGIEGPWYDLDGDGVL